MDSESHKERSDEFLERALFDSRTILLTGSIDHRQAHRVCARLLALSSVASDPILLIVSSPGGHVESGDMIHDMIKFVPAVVRILGSGWVASAGALIYVAARKENRLCLPNTRFLLHEPRGGLEGQASDIAIQAREIVRMRERLNNVFAEATGQLLETIVADTDRDYWMSASEAVHYGLVGRVISSHAELTRQP